MSRYRLVVVAVLCACLIIALLLLLGVLKPFRGHSLAAVAIKGMLLTPIEFYGKVVDQYGAPVEGARASIGAADNFRGPGSDYVKTSDSAGLFSIEGIRGAYLTVGVSKEGYDYLQRKSNGAFRYGKQDPSLRPAPTKDNPAIFVLRKKTQPETLFVAKRSLGFPKDGTPVSVRVNDLKKARPRTPDQDGIDGDFTIQFWVEHDSFVPGNHPKYDWRFRISVPGGGVQERTDPEWQFEAPTDGYQPYLEVNMSKDLPTTPTGDEERWRSSLEEHYFMKLADGRYSRIFVEGYTAERPILHLEAYTTTNPGSRNLEFDPEKSIKPRF